MQWLIDIAKEAMEQWIYDNGIYRYRGDPAAYDFAIGDFTRDNAFHDLDLSAIVPENAKGVHFFVIVQAAGAGEELILIRGGQVNTNNMAFTKTEVGGTLNTADVICACDENRIIQYKCPNGLNQRIDLLVKGWLL